LQANIDHRSQSRSNVFLSASLIVGVVALPVRVRNMSRHGALLDGDSLPPEGTKVGLVRGELSVEGEIAWQRGSQAGIRFSGQIEVAVWVKKIGHAGQQQVDNAIATLRRHEQLPANAEPQSPSLRRIGEELQSICDRLAGSATMTVEFGEELVRLDTLAQRLHQLAARFKA
jgi:hypothetical protein